MATSAEAQYYNQLQAARVRQSRAKDERGVEATVRNKTATATKAALIASGVGTPIAFVAGYLLRNKKIFWTTVIVVLLLLGFGLLLILLPVFLISYLFGYI